MEKKQEILSCGAMQKIWKKKYIYLPLWQMESNLKDQQQAEAAHPEIC